MLRNGLRQTGPSPASAAASRASGDSLLRVERVARERPAQVGAALAQPRVQRGRVLDVQLLEVLLVLARRDVEAAGRDEAAALERIAVRRRERDVLVLGLEVGHLEAARQAHRLERELAGALELLDERAQLARPRRAVEAADADVDRMDLAAADDADQRVAGLLDLQAALDDPAVVARHLDRAVVAEDVGGVEHEHVQRVALDPLAAVDEPAQRPGSRRPTSTPHASSIAAQALIW